MTYNVQFKRSSVAEKRPVASNMLEGEINLNFNAGSAGLFFKNDSGGVVKIGPAHYGPTAPNASPTGSAGNSIGEFWYDTANSTLKIFNGTSWEDLESGLIQQINGSGAISVDNSDPTNPIIGIEAASTTAVGAVQLNDTTSSFAINEALTANQGRILQEQIDALAVTSNLTLAGTYDASTGLLSSVTTAGTAAGFVTGASLPAASATNADLFVIVDNIGSTGPAGAAPYHVGDWFLSDGSAWQFLNVGFQAGYATTDSDGVVQLATLGEVQAGTDDTTAVTPAGLQSKVSDSTTTISSTTIASSTAVKTATDAANAAQVDATQALSDAAAAQATADAAQVDATQALTDAAAAQAAADAAQLDATQALTDAAAAQASADAAQADATLALSTANAAQVDATQAITDSATALAAANAAIPNATMQVKGDLIVGTGSSTYTNLGVGADGYILSADSTAASGVAWISTDAGTY
ncbi:MAG: hypothetical protein ACO22S_04025 [Burkholderiaceae bacterium]